MIIEAKGMPLPGAGPKCNGMMPAGTVFALTSSSLIGSVRHDLGLDLVANEEDLRETSLKVVVLLC